MKNVNLEKTQLSDWHEEAGAKMVPFAGFYMPIQYTSIIDEHLSVRNDAGLFDVSHMGRMWFKGKDAQDFLDTLVPRDVTRASIGQAIYSFALSEKATFKDDLVISRTDEKSFLLVWNAGNYHKLKSWILNIYNSIKRFNSSFDVTLNDVSGNSALFALQGPKAEKILKKCIDKIPGRWKIIEGKIDEIPIYISGTGYTGENGYEIMVPNTSKENSKNALYVWKKIIDMGKSDGLVPVGLGARDSLRLEAGYPLYGNDIDENTNPVEADLVFGPPFVHLDKSGYSFGMNILKKLAKEDPEQLRTGLISLNRQRPKKGMELFYEEQKVGKITSSAYSPILEKGIGMGYIDKDLSKQFGTILTAKKGRRTLEVKISEIPLYDPKKYGYKRE